MVLFFIRDAPFAGHQERIQEKPMGEDSFSEVTGRSWFSRIGDAFKGIVVGLIFLVAAFTLLFWNEGRAVKRYKTLSEGGGAVVSIPVDRVDGANQGRLVHASALASTEETLSDPTFAVQANALKLRRTVEMYQWRENRKSEEKKKLGGGTETVTTYRYEKVWSESLISSSGFKKPSGHQNPSSMAYSSSEQQAGKVSFGAFVLSPSLVDRIRSYSPVRLGAEYRLPAGLDERARLHGNDSVYIGEEPDSPQVGDIRVSFDEVRPLEVSLVAAQAGSSFEPYSTRAGGSIELLQVGTHAAEAMFEKAQRDNTLLTWGLRLLGLILMFLGLKLVLGPLAVLADVVPLLGNIVGAGTGFVAGLTGFILSALTIGFAWVFYRPLLGITLFGVAAGVGVLLFTTLRKKTANRTGRGAAMPPPPPPPPGGRVS
jgi:hypothetical protein